MSESSLKLIPKFEDYLQYMIETILKIPRTEKFSIGNYYKNNMYETLENHTMCFFSYNTLILRGH